MKPRRKMKPSDGRGAAIALAPRLVDVAAEYQNLNTREARVAFVDTWLKSWAYNFERTWPVIYQTLEWVKDEQLFQDPRAIDSSETFPDFKSYFEARMKRPFTLWFELERTHRFVTDFAPELIDETWSEVQRQRAERNQALDAADQANKRDPGRPKTVSTAENDGNSFGRPVGNEAAYALRRLRKDRPDIHARVLAGELTPHAGMVEAGFRKKRPSKKLTPFDRAVRAIDALSQADRDRLFMLFQQRKAA